MVFYEAGRMESVPESIGLQVRPISRADRVEGGLRQPIRLTMDYLYREPLSAWMRLGEGETLWMDLVAGTHSVEDGKESVNFSFPFSMPGWQVRVEVPFGVVRPDVDQIPSACKNWFTMGRWADVSNDSYGVTWVSMDAPLVQVGGVTANLLNSHTDPKVWRREVGETQTLVSWAMNNHWGTNYRAYQEGPVVFRYLVRPHSGYDAAVASRFAVPASQPLLPVRARGAAPQRESLLRLGAQQLLVTGLKPADDGPGVIVRIWNAGDEEVVSGLQWRDKSAAAIYRSDTSERAGEPVQAKLSAGANEMVTIRVE
jgi:alpha-mannosidase